MKYRDHLDKKIPKTFTAGVSPASWNHIGRAVLAVWVWASNLVWRASDCYFFPFPFSTRKKLAGLTRRCDCTHPSLQENWSLNQNSDSSQLNANKAVGCICAGHTLRGAVALNSTRINLWSRHVEVLLLNYVTAELTWSRERYRSVIKI